MKEKIIRAVYDDDTITVYQAYRKEIAIPAIKAQKFVPPFKMERMTWVKPSFLWMMYRSGWATKEGQEYVLAIKITREGWEWALKNSCLSHFVKEVHGSLDSWKDSLQKAPVRIQWDPEKDIFLNNLDYRSIQVGLTGIAVEKYVNDWIVSIEDISDKCRQIHSLVLDKKIEEAKQLLPHENIYPLPDNLKTQILYSS
ncbi:hypothetical protein GCM10011506_44310 [Marivirga lumbricoides]|uniref:DUF4291 domain-containing protein n=1 Tax=Marivirga lumbricoides TaxID=1046115 RepID=A0ABQ1N4F6_9BACT|nr:hypothetical protein GCM10011506_44310 [Marivirga lumbricoides]